MAETLVLAELTVDSRGVVTGVAQATSAISGFDRKLTETGQSAGRTTAPLDAITHRMLNLRSAAVALVGSFSLAGIIFGLKNLAESIVKSDEAFKDLSISASHVKDEFFAVSRNALGVHEGLQEATTWADRFAGALHAIRRAQEEHPAAAAMAREGFIGAVLFGIPGASGIAAGIRSIGSAWDTVFAEDIAAAKEGAPTPAQRVPETFPGRLGKSSVILPPLARRLPDVQFSDELRDTWTDMAQPVLEIGQGWETAADAIDRIQESDIKGMADQFHDMSVGLELLVDSLSAVGAVIGTMVANGGNAKELFADVMKGLAVSMWARSLEYVAYGIASSTGIGAVSLQGTPAQFFAAAAKFAAAGTAAGLLGRTLGGSAPSAPGGTPRGGAAPVQRNVSFNFYGPTFGVNEASMARYFRDLDRRGAGSNS